MIETLGKRLKARRLELQMTQKELSAISNVSQGTISALENQTLKTAPNVETVYKLAQSIHVDFDYLMSDDSSVNFPLQGNLFLVEDKIIKKTPFYKTQQALVNWIVKKERTETYKYFADYLQIDFGLTVSDNTMYPELMINDRIFIHETTDVQNGEIVVAIHKKACIIREIRKEQGQVILRSINPSYTNTSIQSFDQKETHILGKVFFYTRYVEDNRHFQKIIDYYFLNQ